MRLSDIDFHDEPVPPDGYRRLRTRAWWAGFHGLGPEAGGPYTVLVEQVLTEWVPTDPARDWLWDRRFTGEQRWLAGSAERAREFGVDVAPRWPTGRWQAPFGDYFAADAGRVPSAQPGGWQRPDPGFLAGLPRDPELLVGRLDADSPAARPGYCGPLRYARDAMRTGRVPARVREALCAALRLVPGVTVEAARDVSGREGVAFVHDDEVRRSELIINPGDGCFLGEREVANRAMPEHGVAAGTTISETALTTEPTDDLGAPPEPR